MRGSRGAYRFHFLLFAFSFFYYSVTVQFIYIRRKNKITETLDGESLFGLDRSTDGRKTKRRLHD